MVVKSPLISIVIISYDPTAQYVKKTLNILSQQTYRNIELVLVDSGKTNKSSKLVRIFEEKTHITTHIISLPKYMPEYFNYARAYNIGIKATHGDIIIRLSGDAVPKGRRWIENIVHTMKDSKIGVITGRDIIKDQLTIDEYLLCGLYERARKAIAMPNRASLNKKLPLINGPCMVFRKKIWTQHAFNEKWVWGEELEFALWALKHHHYILYDPCMRVYHSHKLPTIKTVRRMQKDVSLVLKANNILKDELLERIDLLLKINVEIPFTLIEKGKRYYLKNGIPLKLIKKYGSDLKKIKDIMYQMLD